MEKLIPNKLVYLQDITHIPRKRMQSDPKSFECQK